MTTANARKKTARRTRLGRFAAVALLPLALVGGAACASERAGQGTIALDGRVDDWAPGTHAAADAEYLYFHLPFGELRSLLTDGKPILIALDADGDARTGVSRAGLGVDIEISMKHRDSWRDPWFFATVFEDERPSPIAFERVEPLAQPTSAAESFELRIRRDAHPVLQGAGRAAGRIELLDGRTVREGRQTRTEDIVLPFEVDLPAGAAVRRVEAELPEKAAGSTRVMSHNVLWSNPEENPEPFGRMYRAIDPDIYLIQEWGRGPWSDAYEAELVAWFAEHVDADREWTAIRCEGWGVAVVTHHEVLERGPVELRAESLTRWDFPIRFAGAVVRTPEAVLPIGSVHLKAGGALGTPEDQRRFDEGREIRAQMRALIERAGEHGDGPILPVLGGDYNHNGHPLVLEQPIRTLDTDGTDLTFAFTPVLGTDSRYSFGGPAYGHRRSFLDYIAFPDASARVATAFVLDTEILSDSSLSRIGLTRSDSSGADHLPVVVDLVPAP